MSFRIAAIGPRDFARARWLGPGMTNCEYPIHLPLNVCALDCGIMNTSLISAFIGAQVGMLQLAVAARLANMDTGVAGLGADNASSIAQLVGAADQSANSLANVAANIGTNLDVSA